MGNRIYAYFVFSVACALAGLGSLIQKIPGSFTGFALASILITLGMVVWIHAPFRWMAVPGGLAGLYLDWLGTNQSFLPTLLCIAMALCLITGVVLFSVTESTGLKERI